MKRIEKLNLADFKAKAGKVESREVLGQIQGGAWVDCHLVLEPIQPDTSNNLKIIKVP